MKWLRWLTVTVPVPVALLALVLIMGGGSLLASYLQNQNYQAGQEHTQVVQRAQGVLIERKLCLDLGTMAGIRAPAGPPAANPSRAYEQAESRAWNGLYAGLGCRR